MHLDRLKVAKTVAELGSLSKAAKTLGIAQSVVSRHVSLLERQWGDRIFERTGRGVTVSEFGRRVLPQMNIVLSQADRLDEIVRDASGVPAGLVRLGILPSMSRLVVGQLMAVLQRKYPAIRLRVTEAFSDSMERGILDGNLDLAIFSRYGSAVAKGEETFGRLRNYLVGTPESKHLSGRKSIPFAQLANVPLALPSAPNGMRAVIEHLSRTKRVHLNVVIEIDTISAMKEICQQANVCSLLPMCAVDDEVEQGILKAVPIVQPDVWREISIGMTFQQPQSRATRATLAELRRLLPQVMRQQGAQP